MVGKEFDLESRQMLSEVLREATKLRCYIEPKRIKLSALEDLATVEPVARLIVEVKRVQSRIGRLDSISAAVRDGKIFPFFNQIKSRTGLVATDEPSLVDLESLSDVKSCFDRSVNDLFVDEGASLNNLAEITNDPLLKKSITLKGDPVIAKHPLMQGFDLDELLLRLAVCQSDTSLSKRYLIARSKITSIRGVLTKRYQTMFRWLNHFRGLARSNGYATNGKLRKYLDGLKSSNIVRREQALEHAVRWLVRY